ncbi:hypothetical protein [Actinokineospora xionganensis]|uniref:Uncharacterized protein n=1 Tax=Actinokineospora xionganensis TaxID=2684470 RepID=A0ABR7LF18_9PSEU|nr:hypothetical protein [Actinokineospora xionganensis]MBC6451301.1 hypothetical protein [Actinokineospora xionganensis]
MNNIDYEIVNPDSAGTAALPSSLDAPAELDAESNVYASEPRGVPPIAVCGHLRRIGVAACRLAKEARWLRGRITARTRGADVLHAWTVTRDNRRLRLMWPFERRLRAEP